MLKFYFQATPNPVKVVFPQNYVAQTWCNRSR